MNDWNEIKAYYLQTRSYKQTSQQFGISENTIKARVRRENWLKNCPTQGADFGEGARKGVPQFASNDKNGGEGAGENALEGADFDEGAGKGAPRFASNSRNEVEGAGGNALEGADFDEGAENDAPRFANNDRNKGEGAGNFMATNPDSRESEPSLFSAEVTTYPNAMSPNSPEVDTVSSVLDAIKTGQFRNSIHRLRQILQRDGKAAYDREKTRLPAFCASGTTPDRRQILKHSHLLQLDFDSLGDSLADARKKVIADPHVAAAFTSPGGNGLKVLLRIDGSKHEQSVLAAAAYFSKNYDLKHDPQVKEPARLCFVSYDPDLYANPLAAPLPLPDEPAPAKKPKRPSKNEPWWNGFKGDLFSLDLVAAFREAGLLGKSIDPDTGKWSVKCPWSEQHSNRGAQWSPADSSTILFSGASTGLPVFKCSHAHCNERKLQDVTEWFERKTPGLIDRHCSRLHARFAAETLKKQAVLSPWDEPTEGAEERLQTLHGEPFYYRISNRGEQEVSDYNLHYWTARFAFENLVLFEPHSNQFYSYLPEKGLWDWQTDAVIRTQISSWMLDYSRRLNQPILNIGRTADRLTSMLTLLRAFAERRSPFHKNSDVIHVANGMLHIDCDPPELRTFSPLYFSLNQCPIPFDQDADCPRFLRQLIYPAMSKEDADLLQLVGGLYLTGRNNWQKILILTGNGGAGKGTIGRIIAAVIGSNNIKQLRTQHLSDRFELDDLDQVSLLVGSDVAGDFLSCSGAKVLKALTGGDPLTMEFKGGKKRHHVGEHNIFITCNDRLRVQLDGDQSAWRRRLLIIPFLQTPTHSMPDFEQSLLEEESSGILNWFLVGAANLADLSRSRAAWPLTPTQQKRIDDLLSESDSLRYFVSSNIERSHEESLTSEEIVSAYETLCAEISWEPLTKRQIERALPPLMMELHRSAKRHDIKRGNTHKRGFMGVRLRSTASTESTASEL